MRLALVGFQRLERKFDSFPELIATINKVRPVTPRGCMHANWCKQYEAAPVLWTAVDDLFPVDPQLRFISPKLTDGWWCPLPLRAHGWDPNRLSCEQDVRDAAVALEEPRFAAFRTDPFFSLGGHGGSEGDGGAGDDPPGSWSTRDFVSAMEAATLG